MIESLRLSETDNILQKRLFSLSINIILVNGNEAGKLTQNFLPLFYVNKRSKKTQFTIWDSNQRRWMKSGDQKSFDESLKAFMK